MASHAEHPERRRGVGLGGGARPMRLETETKASFKTTELFAYVATVAGILVAGAVIDSSDGTDRLVAHQVWLYVAIVTIGYMISRGLAKSGSRDPYWAERGDRDADT